MTKKDFKLIAGILRDVPMAYFDLSEKSLENYKSSVVKAFIEVLKTNNERFNEDKFIEYIYGKTI